MQTRRFGTVDVPVFGIGTWKMEYDDRSSAIAAIRRAIGAGMTHVDTAELYGMGKVETMVGEALAGLRDQVFLVSKVLPRNATYAGTIKACEQSLRRLQTDHLDCYLLHWREDLPLAETFRAFETLREHGKVRAWGVSNFDDGDLAEAHRLVGDGVITCNQVCYHLKAREIEHRVIPWCAEHDVAVVAYSPFGSGNFPRNDKTLGESAARHAATPHQVALAVLARHPRMFVIPKSSNVAHVDELARAASLTLSADDHKAIEAAFPRGPWRGLPTL